MIFFMTFYFLGLTDASEECLIAKRKLPIYLKRILFLGGTNKFTLYAIIYQALLFILTITVALIFFINLVFELDLNEPFINAVYFTIFFILSIPKLIICYIY